MRRESGVLSWLPLRDTPPPAAPTVAVVVVDPVPPPGLGERHGRLLGREAAEPELHEQPLDRVVRSHAGVTEAQRDDLDPDLVRGLFMEGEGERNKETRKTSESKTRDPLLQSILNKTRRPMGCLFGRHCALVCSRTW